MAVYRLTVEKYLASQAVYWTNVYHADPSSEGTLPMNALVAAERPLYTNDVAITKVTQDLVEVDSNYAQPLIVNLTGTRSSPAGDRQPLFVTARVDLVYAGSRPGRKYLRGVLFEADTNFTTLSGSALTLLNNYLTALLAIEGLCDADGDPLQSGAVFNAPAMRQLRRGSKKKVTP